ncbi:MAG: glycosyltransferase [Streptosporangiales bacterium]|nr:glycosyltransferase [Streptosporangiales bacterium]
MRIALVSEHASPLAALGGVDAGGQNVHVAALAHALARRGHDVLVHTRRDSPDLPSRVRAGPGVTVHHVPAGPAAPVPKDELPPYMPEFAAHLARAWAERPPDVVHAHFWMSGLAALDAAGPREIPVVQTFHALGTVKRRYQGPADTSPPERIAREAELGLRAHRIVATCSDEVAELVAMGVPRDRVSVVPCGVDLEEFRPGGPCVRWDTGPRVIALGRMVPRKGFDTVIRAVAALPGVRLDIVGGPPANRLGADPEATRLRAVAHVAGVAGRVHFHGGLPREQVPAYLRSADVAVSVPWYEPFGMAVVESMACGAPVVASAVGGHLDTVVDGVTGDLVPPRAPEPLTRALHDLLEDPRRRAAYAAVGAERVRRAYGWDDVAGRTERAYRHALGRPADEEFTATRGEAR